YVANRRALVSPEEKQAILLDRPAQAAAKLVALQEIVRPREEIAGVQVAVAQKLEGASVQLVRAGLGHHVDDPARSTAILGAVTIGLNAEFFDGVRVRKWIVHVGVVVLIAAAVQVVIDVIGAGAIG